jgi:hypothetical protein
MMNVRRIPGRIQLVLSAIVIAMCCIAPDSIASAQANSSNASAVAELRGALNGSTDKVFGVSPAGNSQGISAIPELSSELAHPIEVVNFFVGWGESLPTSSMNLVVEQGGIPELTFEPWNYTKGVDQPQFSDGEIASGAYDTYLFQLAQAAAAWHTPFLFRYGHEMNGTWYPWAASVNGNTPASYVAVWRHVHQLFDRAGASNVIWVWCPNADGPTPVSDVFPGPTYVNVVGMDGYNWGTTNGGWRTPSQIFSGLIAKVRAISPGLPLLINETGSAEAGGSKALWLSQLFSLVEAQSRLAGVVYSEFGSLWPLTTSSSALASAKRSLASY